MDADHARTHVETPRASFQTMPIARSKASIRFLASSADNLDGKGTIPQVVSCGNIYPESNPEDSTLLRSSRWAC